MKTLLLLRHAKSSWDDSDLDDFDRPLASRGAQAAPRIGRYMAKKLGAPGLALVSAAVRTQQTWELVAGAFDPVPATKRLRGPYLATPSRLLATIRRVPDEVERLLLLGHNPGLETLAGQLCGSGKRRARETMAKKFPTGALAELRFDIDHWADVAAGTGELCHFVRPKDLC